MMSKRRKWKSGIWLLLLVTGIGVGIGYGKGEGKILPVAAAEGTGGQWFSFWEKICFPMEGFLHESMPSQSAEDGLLEFVMGTLPLYAYCNEKLEQEKELQAYAEKLLENENSSEPGGTLLSDALRAMELENNGAGKDTNADAGLLGSVSSELTDGEAVDNTAAASELTDGEAVDNTAAASELADGETLDSVTAASELTDGEALDGVTTASEPAEAYKIQNVIFENLGLQGTDSAEDDSSLQASSWNLNAYQTAVTWNTGGTSELTSANGVSGLDAGGLSSFQPSIVKAMEYTKEQLSDQEFVLKTFYAVDSGTTAPLEKLDAEKLLAADVSIDTQAQGPQILIYHTHSQEAFADSAKGDASDTITGVGEHLASILEETYGYKVLHHTGQYDTSEHDYAYSYALPEISKILEENPSIQVVIDLHRDEMAEGTKLVTECGGLQAAQIMFFNGLSYVNTTGAISYLENPNLSSNLAFSFQMQKTANEYYPGLARKIYLKGYRYNMHLAEKYLLIELGAQTNTVEEAMNACYPLADILDKVLRSAG